jgi:hypothetical protein
MADARDDGRHANQRSWNRIICTFSCVAQRRPERAILLGELLYLALADFELVTQNLYEVPACVHL